MVCRVEYEDPWPRLLGGIIVWVQGMPQEPAFLETAPGDFGVHLGLGALGLCGH